MFHCSRPPLGRREEETEEPPTMGRREEPPTSRRSDPHPQLQKKHVETDEDSGDDVPLGPAQGQTKERTPQEFIVSGRYYYCFCQLL